MYNLRSIIYNSINLQEPARIPIHDIIKLAKQVVNTKSVDHSYDLPSCLEVKQVLELLCQELPEVFSIEYNQLVVKTKGSMV